MKIKPYPVKKTFLIILTLQFFGIHSLFSIDFFFDGVGDYTNISLWSPSYPGESIASGNTVIIMNESICTLPEGTGLFIQGTFINNGEFISYNSFGCFTNGTFINNGTALFHATFDNLGHVENNGMITTELAFSNQGGGDFTNASSSTIINHTSFIVSSPSSLVLEGELKGEGNITITDYPNEGIINPGFSPGILTFQFGLDLKSNGTLQIELAGNTGAGVVGGHDQIQVMNGGGLAIDGTLEVILLGGYTPNIGDSWTIATGATSGTFSNLILPAGYSWDVDIQSGSIVLEVINVSLPVEMVNFFGKINNSDISLHWTTLTEDNHEGWEIEHLSILNEWTNVGFVEGTNGNQINNYSFIHKKPNLKINYYRLKQMDFDGATEYSNIVAVDLSVEQVPLSVYPNPSNGKLFFSKEIETVEIINLQGKSILIKTIESNQLDLTGMASGEYFVVIGEKENLQILKIILNR